MLGDEAQALYRRSIERGQGDVNKVRQRLKFARFPEDAVEPSPRRPRGAELAAEEWRAALDKLNLPTATQVKALTQQVADLEAKIEKLRSGD